MRFSAFAVAMVLAGGSPAMADAVRLQIAPGVAGSAIVVGAALAARLEASALDQLARHAAMLSQMTKDEFEKTSEFNDRKAAVVRQSVIGEWSVGQDLTVVVEGIGRRWLYNADDERFEAHSSQELSVCLTLDCQSFYFNSLGSIKAVRYIAYDERLSKSAESGLTAMRVAFDYIKTTGVREGLSVSIFKEDYRTSGDYRVIHSFAVPRDEARAVKGNLAAALSGKLVNPYLLRSVDGSTPKLDSPFETDIKIEVIAFLPTDLVIFDISTRKTFARFRVGDDGRMTWVQSAVAAATPSAIAAPTSGPAGSNSAVTRTPPPRP
jgi:hypothetical protein